MEIDKIRHTARAGKAFLVAGEAGIVAHGCKQFINPETSPEGLATVAFSAGVTVVGLLAITAAERLAIKIENQRGR